MKDARLLAAAAVNSHWVIVAANSIAALAPGIFNSNLTLWDAHSFQGSQTAADSTPLLLMCTVFIVAWAVRGACAALSMNVPDDALEALLREALQQEDVPCCLPDDELWNSFVDAPTVRWTTWSEMLRVRAATRGPNLVGPDGTLSLTPLSGHRMCLQHLIAASISSGASVLVEGHTQRELDTLTRSLRGSVLSSEQGHSLEWISAASSASADAQHLRALIHGCMAQVHPRLLRSSSGNRIVLQVDDVHASQPSASVSSTMIEFIRSYLDLHGFVHPWCGYQCHTPDLQLVASAVPLHLPASYEVTRIKAKLLCVSALDSCSSLMDGPVLSQFSLLELQNTCEAFMHVMQESMSDCVPEAPASQLSAFLASVIQGVCKSHSNTDSRLCFDLDTVQQMLECVHADLVLPAIDDLYAGASVSTAAHGVSGSAMIELFGCLLEGQDSEEALARRALISRSIQVHCGCLAIPSHILAH